MKTNLKTAILGIALMASVTGAFAADIANAISGKKLVAYSWQKYHRNGTPDGSPQPGDENSLIDECLGGTSTVCAIGTSDDGPTLTRFYDPL